MNVAAASEDGSGSADVFMALASSFYRRHDALSGPDFLDRLYARVWRAEGPSGIYDPEPDGHCVLGRCGIKCTVKPIFFCTVQVFADEPGRGNLKSAEITLDGFETRSTTRLNHSDVATTHISTGDAVRRPHVCRSDRSAEGSCFTDREDTRACNIRRECRAAPGIDKWCVHSCRHGIRRVSRNGSARASAGSRSWTLADELSAGRSSGSGRRSCHQPANSRRRARAGDCGVRRAGDSGARRRVLGRIRADGPRCRSGFVCQAVRRHADTLRSLGNACVEQGSYVAHLGRGGPFRSRRRWSAHCRLDATCQIRSDRRMWSFPDPGAAVAMHGDRARVVEGIGARLDCVHVSCLTGFGQWRSTASTKSRERQAVHF